MTIKSTRWQMIELIKVSSFVFLISSAANSFSQQLSAAQIAGKLYQRLNGVPLTSNKKLPGASANDPTILQAMVIEIEKNNLKGAADIAVQTEEFIDITVKQFLTPLSNVERLPDIPLNDFVATGAGIVRDNLDFRLAMYGDIYYKAAPTMEFTPANNVANPPAANVPNDRVVRISTGTDGNGKTALESHYEQFEARGFKLSNPAQLVRVTQSSLPNFVITSVSETKTLNQNQATDRDVFVQGQIPADATSGVLTTWKGGQQFIKAGTNRRMFKYSLLNFLCREMENIHDTTQPDFMVRRDVLRDPTGDSRVFKAQCAGCHAVQDAATPAYLYYDFNTFNNSVASYVYSKGSNQIAKKFIIEKSYKDCEVLGGTIVNPDMTAGTGARMPFCHLSGRRRTLGGVNIPSYTPNIAAPAAGTALNPAVTNPRNDFYVDSRVNFDGGFKPTTDRWLNHMVGAVNKKIGWKNGTDAETNASYTAMSGTGMKALHFAMANSDGFSECMTERVYAKVCVLSKNKKIQMELSKIAADFRTSYNYKMKDLFSSVAETCVRAESEAVK